MLRPFYSFDLQHPIYYNHIIHISSTQKPYISQKDLQMAEKLDQNELVSFKELLISNSIQIDTVTQLLIEKGYFTKEEFFAMLKRVQMEYKKKDDT